MAKGLRLDQICIERRGTRMVEIDRLVPPGEVLTVMGPSGSGKSTLLSYVIGALAPGFKASGRVLIDDEDLTDLAANQRHIGILFQDDLLFPHMSVAQNLAFGLPHDLKGEARPSAVAAALDEIELADFADRDPATLSGGQKIRVSLMRMLLSEPRALLLDEPFSRLDADLRRTIRDLVFDRARAKALPVLMVTHDESDADAAGGPVHRLT